MKASYPIKLTQKRLSRLLLGFLFAALAVLAACSPTADEGDPAAAVEAYLAAMIANDREALPSLVCPAFEGEAITEFDSFGAVDASLEDADCTTGEVSGDNGVVMCTGQISYVYNGETDAQDLSLDEYVVERVDGAWTMCGYQ